MIYESIYDTQNLKEAWQRSYAPYAKGNFVFEHTIPLNRSHLILGFTLSPRIAAYGG